MPEHHMIFNIPEDKAELEDAMDGAKLRACAQSFDNYLRSKVKYGEYEGAKLDMLNEIRKEFNDIFQSFIW